MKKYIVKNCPALRLDRVKYKICHDRNAQTRCSEIDDCIIKQIVKLMPTKCQCDNCDGIGYFDGCIDTECSFYKLMQIRKLIEMEEKDDAI